MGWEPLLEGRLADGAWAAVRAIAEHIDEIEPKRRSPIDGALFWAYVAGALDDEASAARFEAAVAVLEDYIEGGIGFSSLYGGLTGVGWTLAHISEGAGEILDEIDRAVIAELDASDPWRGHYDLIVGLVGYGVYFLERLRNEAAAAGPGLARVVDRLASASQPADDGVTWHTRSELLPAWQRELCPEGYFNLGLAHGVPGVVGVLGAIAAAGQGETSARARSLGDAATRWLRARGMPAHPRGRFAAWIGVGEQSPEPARTAWCYGDPGVAAAAWSAAIRTGADEGEWRDLALESMLRPLEHSGIIDPNLCHGAAGLAHLCNRFYQASGDPRFRDAGRGWFERVLAMRRPGEGIAGFTTLRPAGADGKSLEHEAVPDFLDGTAGVALALLAALRAEEPGWDRLLLCDLPPRDRA